eukprot:3873181-Pyramimonas_sp.AAC.1
MRLAPLEQFAKCRPKIIRRRVKQTSKKHVVVGQNHDSRSRPYRTGSICEGGCRKRTNETTGVSA